MVIGALVRVIMSRFVDEKPIACIRFYKNYRTFNIDKNCKVETQGGVGTGFAYVMRDSGSLKTASFKIALENGLPLPAGHALTKEKHAASSAIDGNKSQKARSQRTDARFGRAPP